MVREPRSKTYFTKKGNARHLRRAEWHRCGSIRQLALNRWRPKCFLTRPAILTDLNRPSIAIQDELSAPIISAVIVNPYGDNVPRCHIGYVQCFAHCPWKLPLVCGRYCVQQLFRKCLRCLTAALRQREVMHDHGLVPFQNVAQSLSNVRVSAKSRDVLDFMCSFYRKGFVQSLGDQNLTFRLVIIHESAFKKKRNRSRRGIVPPSTTLAVSRRIIPPRHTPHS